MSKIAERVNADESHDQMRDGEGGKWTKAEAAAAEKKPAAKKSAAKKK